MRLLEMQRKLSAIAEIPKILSSTLATVSQSFGRMSELDREEQEEACVQRKFSYDEDALDYELRDDDEPAGDSDSDEDDLVQVKDDEEEDEVEASIEGGRQSKLLKDVTPESDYASEANYPANEASDDTESEDETEGSAVYFIKLPAASKTVTVEDSEASSCPSDVEDVDDDSDFLSTTYTWNLRNVPKLRINDTEADDEKDELQGSSKKLDEDMPEKKEPKEVEHLQVEQSKVRPATPTPQPPPQDSAKGQAEKVMEIHLAEHFLKFFENYI